MGDAAEISRRCSPLLRALCGCAISSRNEKVAIDSLLAVASTVRHASTRLGPEDVRSIYAASLPAAASRAVALRTSAESALDAIRGALPPGMQLSALARAVGGASARGASKSLGPALAQLAILLQGPDGATAAQHAPLAAKSLARRLAKVVHRGASSVTGARDAVAAGLGDGMGSSATPGQAAAAAAVALAMMASSPAVLPLAAASLGAMIEAEVRSVCASMEELGHGEAASALHAGAESYREQALLSAQGTGEEDGAELEGEAQPSGISAGSTAISAAVPPTAPVDEQPIRAPAKSPL